MIIKGYFDYRLTSKVFKMQKTLKMKEDMSSDGEGESEDGEGEGDKSDEGEAKQHRIRVDSMLYKRASFIRQKDMAITMHSLSFINDAIQLRQLVAQSEYDREQIRKLEDQKLKLLQQSKVSNVNNFFTQGNPSGDDDIAQLPKQNSKLEKMGQKEMKKGFRPTSKSSSFLRPLQRRDSQTSNYFIDEEDDVRSRVSQSKSRRSKGSIKKQDTKKSRFNVTGSFKTLPKIPEKEYKEDEMLNELEEIQNDVIDEDRVYVNDRTDELERLHKSYLEGDFQYHLVKASTELLRSKFDELLASPYLDTTLFGCTLGSFFEIHFIAGGLFTHLGSFYANFDQFQSLTAEKVYDIFGGSWYVPVVLAAVSLVSLIYPIAKYTLAVHAESLDFFLINHFTALICFALSTPAIFTSGTVNSFYLVCIALNFAAISIQFRVLGWQQRVTELKNRKEMVLSHVYKGKEEYEELVYGINKLDLIRKQCGLDIYERVLFDLALAGDKRAMNYTSNPCNYLRNICDDNYRKIKKDWGGGYPRPICEYVHQTWYEPETEYETDDEVSPPDEDPSGEDSDTQTISSINPVKKFGTKYLKSLRKGKGKSKRSNKSKDRTKQDQEEIDRLKRMLAEKQAKEKPKMFREALKDVMAKNIQQQILQPKEPPPFVQPPVEDPAPKSIDYVEPVYEDPAEVKPIPLIPKLQKVGDPGENFGVPVPIYDYPAPDVERQPEFNDYEQAQDPYDYHGDQVTGIKFKPFELEHHLQDNEFQGQQQIDPNAPLPADHFFQEPEIPDYEQEEMVGFNQLKKRNI